MQFIPNPVLPRYVKPEKLVMSTNYFCINGNYSYSHFFKLSLISSNLPTRVAQINSFWDYTYMQCHAFS